MFKIITRFLNSEEAFAHCDIPCGIYDPVSAKIAAQTVLKMTMRIEAQAGSSDAASANSFSRYVTVKEEHATLCKNEIDILWHDYFKPEHLEEYPDLHDLFWNSLKLASKVRQEIDIEAAQNLLVNVQKITDIFWKTKGAEVSRQPSLQTGGGELIYPVANG